MPSDVTIDSTRDPPAHSLTDLDSPLPLSALKTVVSAQSTPPTSLEERNSDKEKNLNEDFELPQFDSDNSFISSSLGTVHHHPDLETQETYSEGNFILFFTHFEK